MKKLLCLLTSAAVLSFLCGCSSVSNHCVIKCDCDLPAAPAGSTMELIYAGTDWDKPATSLTIIYKASYDDLKAMIGHEVTDDDVQNFKNQLV